MNGLLQYCPELRSLSFPIPALSKRRVPLDLVDELRSIVASLPSAELRYLTMSEAVRSFSREGAKERRHPAEEVIRGGEATTIVIEEGQFEHLERVTVDLRPMNYQTDDEMVEQVDMIRHIFSSWDSRGILEIS